MAGWLPLFSPSFRELSQRSGANIGFINGTANFAFINQVLAGDGFCGPFGNDFNSVAPYTQLIDANGYPNDAAADGLRFGGGTTFPASADFSGPFVATWDNEGELSFDDGVATYTESNNTGTTYTRTTNGRWKTISGQTAKVIFTTSGFSNATLIPFTFRATGGAGGFAKNLRIYRQSDETDLLAGKVYRAAWKQQIVDSKQGFMRFMDQHGYNNSHDCRWENRMLPTNAGYGDSTNWAASPKYNAMTDSGGNQYSVAAVSTGTKQTPASMQHGEIATIRATTSAVRTVAVTIQAITSGSTTSVQANSHPFNTGDRVLHLISSGMTQLDMVPCTIAKVDANNYTFTTVNTTGYTAFTSGVAVIDLSLTVGSGSDRTAYPVLFGDGLIPACYYGTYIAAPGNPTNSHGTYTFVFDKNINGYGTGSGYNKGAWLFNNAGGGPAWGGVPAEIITKCIIELNEMSSKPIDLWINIPHRGLLSSDPDYSAGSNWAVNLIDTIWNGAGSYTGLKNYPNINIVCELSNEIWNPTESTQYMKSWSYSRWGSAIGRSNYWDSHAFRAVNAVKDIKAAGFTSPRIKHIFGLWAALGMEPGAFGANYEGVFGSDVSGDPGYFYKRDSYVLAQGWGLPATEMDGFCIAPYIDPPRAYYTTGASTPSTGAGTLSDDAALYAGTAPYGSPNQSQAITNFVTAMTTATGGTATGDFIATQFPSFLNRIGVGKYLLCYEGAHNVPTNAGDIYYDRATSSAESTLIEAALKSSAWGTALTGMFTTVCNSDSRVKLPAVFNIWGGNPAFPSLRWSFCRVTSYASNIEGQALTNNAAWQAVVTRNSGLA